MNIAHVILLILPSCLAQSQLNTLMDCNSLRYRNKCYYLALSQENWYTSRDYCLRIGYTLARIQSADEASFIGSHLRGYAVSNAGWTGGYSNPQNQQNMRLYWVDLNDERQEGIWVYSDGTPGYTDFWNAGEPNGNRAENCGELVVYDTGVGRLNDKGCGEIRKYICERTSDTVCPRGGYRKKCYWYSVQPATWFNAREYCATMGQRLARITASDEASYLALHQQMPSWVDLRYGGQGVGWTYADGSSAGDFSNLFGGVMGGGGGYGQRCAEIRRYNFNEGRVIGQDCNMLKPFICEREVMPAGSEIIEPENEPGSVMGSQIGGQAIPPAGPVNSNDPSMTGGVAGLSMSMVGSMDYSMAGGMGGMGGGMGGPMNGGMGGMAGNPMAGGMGGMGMGGGMGMPPGGNMGGMGMGGGMGMDPMMDGMGRRRRRRR